MKVLVTGGAGFIGSHLCDYLISRGDTVVAVDNFDPFYPEATKRRNLDGVIDHDKFDLIDDNVQNVDGIARKLSDLGHDSFDVVVHLAARAGVRPSLEKPLQYVDANVLGTAAMLELANRMQIGSFVFGSSSSVYGNNAKVPFAEADLVEEPISPYAATKRSGELLCRTYHHLYGTSVICLRFFTVFGPRQRPDLAIHKFARLMLDGLPIPMYGDGSTERDYTYIEDILSGIVAAMDLALAHPRNFEIINLGGNQTTSLKKLIDTLSASLDIEPKIQQLPTQPGDVSRTFADIDKAGRLLRYRPQTGLKEGIDAFVGWLLEAGQGVPRN